MLAANEGHLVVIKYLIEKRDASISETDNVR
jgi:hypothetical protein